MGAGKTRIGGLIRTAGRALSFGAVTAATASAQAPGLPALQNAFANPGLAAAANLGGGGGQSFFGLAAGYGLAQGRLQLSGAAGAQRANSSTRGAYGGRLAATVWTSSGGALGIAGFAGLGGAPRTRSNDVTTNPAVITVPAGLSVGYRRALGASRGVSAYVAPLYRWTRTEANDTTSSSGNIGGAVGVDFAVTQSFGVTLGGEFGKSSDSGTGSATFGLAVTFVPRR
jgi:hypothetical protein